MAGITTVGGHVARALDFFARTDVYVVIGRTTPWTTETVPPNPEQETTAVDEVVAYKKIELMQLVRPAETGESGTIDFRTSSWVVVASEEDALDEGARWVYVEAFLRYDEVPLVTFRQIGLHSRLVPGIVATILGDGVDSVYTTTATTGVINLDINGTPTEISVTAQSGESTPFDGASTAQVVTELNAASPSTIVWKEEPDSPSAGESQLRVSTVDSGPSASLTFLTPTVDSGEEDMTAILGFQVNDTDTGADVPPGQFALLPSEVEDPGILEILDNRPPITRVDDQQEKLAIVIEF